MEMLNAVTADTFSTWIVKMLEGGVAGDFATPMEAARAVVPHEEWHVIAATVAVHAAERLMTKAIRA